MAIERRKDNKKRVLKEGEYQRANGTFEYKWRDRRGKRHSIYAKTLEELREKENDVLRNVLDGLRSDVKDVTINDLYHIWKQIKRGLKDNTFQNYQYMYEQFVMPDFGNSRIHNLKRTDIRSFYNRLADDQNLKPSTIDSIHTVLHQVLELGVEDNYMRFNPSDNALRELKKSHNIGIKKKKALTKDEQDLLEGFLKKSNVYKRWLPIITVMLWTGMRVGEVTGLRWCDIDLDEGVININHTLVYYDKRDGTHNKCTYAINTPKTEAGRRQIPMMAKVKEAFILEKEMQEELGIKCNTIVDGYTDFIFLNRFGLNLNQGTLNKVIKRIIRDCNYEVMDKNKNLTDVVLLPPFSNHTLRHTFTTRMCEAGVNIKAMQDILGHADAETTMNIYAEATKELKQTALQDLSKYFSDEPSSVQTAS